MSKSLMCPKHKLPLSLRDETLTIAGSSYDVCIGTCVKCKVMYISHQIMSCSNVTIAGQKYEYLPTLPNKSGKSQASVVSDSTARGRDPQNMEDIERFFLTAEKRIQRDEELDRLLAQNAALQHQLEETLQQMSEMTRRHAEQLMEVRITAQRKVDDARHKQLQAEDRLQFELTRIAHELEQKHNKVLEETVAEYQERISRLVKIREDALEEARRAAGTEIRNLHGRIAVLQQRNNDLEQQVQMMTRKLTQTGGSIRQIVFVDDKLYVCGGKIRCEMYAHWREEVNGIIDTVRGTTVTMTVCYCKECKLYFVRDTVFDSYLNKYGSMLGRFVCLKDGSQLGLGGYGELAPESLLHMNGYNVNQTVDLSTEERRKILTYVIESRIMNKADIRNHLSFLIKQNQSRPNMSVAVSRWQADMMWVNDYHAGQQSTVWLRGTAMYRHRHR